MDVVNYFLTAIMIGISGAWIFLIKSMNDSFRLTPSLEDFKKMEFLPPKISVILPARNEEEFISACLDSLVNQDYENYEVIAINDSSTDSTLDIIESFAKNNPKVIVVNAKPKPSGWMGKNWACMEGYKRATGSILLFTDADTIHSKKVISMSVSHLISKNLDALTIIPKMVTVDLWTKITLPMISTFLHTRFSALKVNNPKKNTGYFFGSFFIIKKEVYDKVGKHEGVKQEIIEDGALGKLVKSSGFSLRMVRGEHLIKAIWARDRSTLWNALKRLMVPLCLQNGRIAIGIFLAVLFLLFIPFPILGYSLIFADKSFSFSLLFLSAIISSVLIYIGALLEAKKALFLHIHHALMGPIGSLVIVLAFLTAIIQANSDTAVSWRGRDYSLKEQPQNSINL